MRAGGGASQVSRLLVLSILSVCSWSCMVQPENGQHLEDTHQWFTFAGFHPRPGLDVELQVYNRVDQKWEVFANFRSAAEPTLFDSDGSQWFPWGGRAQIPQGITPLPEALVNTNIIYWRQQGARTLTADLRARSGDHVLSSLGEGGFGCAMEKYRQTQSARQALAACRSSEPVVSVRAPCGGKEQACCQFAPTCEIPGARCLFDRCTVGEKMSATGTFPAHVTAPWVANVQGVTHDGQYWYVNSNTHFYKVPVSTSLAAGSFVKSARPFKKYKHLGDSSYHEGRIYVPLEQGPAGSKLGIGVMDTDFQELGIVATPEAKEASWCAVHPLSGRLYTSDFDATRLRVYRIDWESGFSLHREADVRLRVDGFDFKPLMAPFPRVQGGAFAPEGTLYLVSDVRSVIDLSPWRGGIYGLVAETGIFKSGIMVDYKPEAVNPCPTFLPLVDSCRHEELEGITFWDLDGGLAPGISGQLHLLQLDNFPSKKYWFKHYRVSG